VAIVGAGELGGAVARALVARNRSGWLDAIDLIDHEDSIATGKALDLRQSAPIVGFDTAIGGWRDPADAAGADLIVLADPAGASGREWGGDEALALVRRLSSLGLTDRSILVWAGASQRAIMQRTLDELQVPRTRVVGSAPEALAAAACALAAIDAGVAASQVSLSVLGVPPNRMVIPFMQGSIAGHTPGTFLSPPQIHRLEHRITGLWPPGVTALGAAAARLCEAALTDSPWFFSVFASLDRDSGVPAPVCAWPVAMGRQGIARVANPQLDARDQLVIDGALEGRNKRESLGRD
jgi:malate dehydrogenase